MERSDVVIVGAGIVGISTAWRCAQRGLSVTVVDAGAERPGAWHAAAGMLAPVTELHFTETALLRLSLESNARWAAWAAELESVTGRRAGYLACGAVETAWDGADLQALADLHGFATSLGLASSMLTGRELRDVEPSLAPGLPGGRLAEGDHQVDPRLAHAAITAAASACGVRVVRGIAVPELRGGTAVGVRLADGTRLGAATVVLAAGAWSAQLTGLPLHDVPPVRPVKGQTLRLRLPGPPRLTRVLRATVQGTPVYVVPRRQEGGSTQYVVGASSEEAGFDLQPRAGAIYELLRDAQTVLPDLAEAALEDVSTGLRPGSPDNAPILGPAATPGLVLATGHHRNGVLLAPVTADGLASLLAEGALPDNLTAFCPERFARSEVACTSS